MESPAHSWLGGCRATEGETLQLGDLVLIGETVEVFAAFKVTTIAVYNQLVSLPGRLNAEPVMV